VALPLTVFFPLIFLMQRTRRRAYAIALTYYLASTWPLVPGAKTFFGPHSSWQLSLGFWLTASALLAIPCGLFYFCSWPARYASVAAAVAATTFPPVGFVGWASPVTSAGLLFPGFGWLGILAMLVLPPVIVRHRLLGIFSTIALMVSAYSVQ